MQASQENENMRRGKGKIEKWKGKKKRKERKKEREILRSSSRRVYNKGSLRRKKIEKGSVI